jgi:hypothetical protein
LRDARVERLRVESALSLERDRDARERASGFWLLVVWYLERRRG